MAYMKAGKMEVRPKGDRDLREKSVPGLGTGGAWKISRKSASAGSGPFLPGELRLSEWLSDRQ